VPELSFRICILFDPVLARYSYKWRIHIGGLVSLSVHKLQVCSQLTDFVEISYITIAAARHLLFLQSKARTWRMHEFLRMERHQRHFQNKVTSTNIRATWSRVRTVTIKSNNSIARMFHTCLLLRFLYSRPAERPSTRGLSPHPYNCRKMRKICTVHIFSHIRLTLQMLSTVLR
jgi:hypothetical protein